MEIFMKLEFPHFENVVLDNFAKYLFRIVEIEVWARTIFLISLQITTTSLYSSCHYFVIIALRT